MPETGQKTVNAVSRLSNFWNLFVWRDPNDFLSRLVTMDGTWLYHYDRRQSNSQRSGGIAAHPAEPQKIPSAKFRWNSSRLDFWDQDGIPITDCLPMRPTINAECYPSLLVQLKDILKDKRRGKETKYSLFFHDHGPAHRALAAGLPVS